MRTCVGCRNEDESEAMIRLVLGDEGAIVVDLAGRSFGRGAWVHPRTECLAQAARGGLARSFKTKVTASPAGLLSEVRQAADRKVEALLSAARGAGRLAPGSDVARAECEAGRAKLLVVATDARAAADQGFVGVAGSRGMAMVWGTKERIGRAVARPETAVVAVTDDGLARAMAQAIALSVVRDPDPLRAGGDTDQSLLEVR